MRVLYVAPRYHTNQISVVKGWMDSGHQVMFISQFKSTPEDYHILEPIILGYSRLADGILSIAAKLFYRNKYTKAKEYRLKVKAGIPPIKKMKWYLNNFRPDIVIVRERALYNIPFYNYCKKRGIPCILYNQSPVWDVANRDSGLAHRMLISLLPKYRITPVLGNEGANKIKMKNTVYVPFVIEPRIAPEDKTHLFNGKIQILCVARYEERKNLFMLVDVINDLIKKYDIFLTIIGEATDEMQLGYYRRLQDRIKEYGINEKVLLLKNLDMESMYREYGKADLFVLPSSNERASISQLEAMSCSVPVICSETNGTACYIKNGKNGYVFRELDRKDLEEKIEMIISHKKVLLQMGKCSYNEVIENYQFSNYYRNIMDIVKRQEDNRH